MPNSKWLLQLFSEEIITASSPKNMKRTSYFRVRQLLRFFSNVDLGLFERPESDDLMFTPHAYKANKQVSWIISQILTAKLIISRFSGHDQHQIDRGAQERSECSHRKRPTACTSNGHLPSIPQALHTHFLADYGWSAKLCRHQWLPQNHDRTNRALLLVPRVSDSSFLGLILRKEQENALSGEWRSVRSRGYVPHLNEGQTGGKMHVLEWYKILKIG